jgi:hypothetical protein
VAHERPRDASFAGPNVQTNETSDDPTTAADAADDDPTSSSS